MLNQDLSKVLTGHISRYSLVTATAKLAREISDKNLEDKVITTEKPVSDSTVNTKSSNPMKLQIFNNEYRRLLCRGSR